LGCEFSKLNRTFAQTWDGFSGQLINKLDLSISQVGNFRPVLSAHSGKFLGS